MDRAVVPTGLSYEERERQGTEMVPYADRPVARAMTQPPAGVVVQPVQAVARLKEGPKRPTQAQLADKDRDALFRRIAQAPQDIVGRVDAMHGLLGNERRHRAIAPRDRSPERTKARKRDRERERPGPVDRPMIKSGLFLPAPEAPEDEPRPALAPSELGSRQRAEKRREEKLDVIRKKFAERIQRKDAALPEKRSAEDVEPEDEAAKLQEDDLTGFETAPPTQLPRRRHPCRPSRPRCHRGWRYRAPRPSRTRSRISRPCTCLLYTSPSPRD